MVRGIRVTRYDFRIGTHPFRVMVGSLRGGSEVGCRQSSGATSPSANRFCRQVTMTTTRTIRSVTAHPPKTPPHSIQEPPEPYNNHVPISLPDATPNAPRHTQASIRSDPASSAPTPRQSTNALSISTAAVLNSCLPGTLPTLVCDCGLRCG